MPAFISDIEELPAGGFYLYGAGAAAQQIKAALSAGQKPRQFLGFLTSFAAGANSDQQIYHLDDILPRISAADNIVIACQYSREIGHDLAAKKIPATMFDAILLVFDWPQCGWSEGKKADFEARATVVAQRLKSERSQALYRALCQFQLNSDAERVPDLYSGFYRTMDRFYGTGDAYDSSHYFEYDVFDSVKTVIEGGSNIGAVSQQLLNHLPPEGRLYSFEPMADEIAAAYKGHRILEQLKREAAAGRYMLIDKALWSETSSLYMHGSGGNFSTHHLAHTGDAADRVATISIDDFCAENQIDKLDFLKLDVEAAEPYVLEGARQTIARDRPALAISIYHHGIQFVTVPEQLMAMLENYEFEIGHHSNSPILETVLYCKPLG